jgi:hypothetical protein
MPKFGKGVLILSLLSFSASQAQTQTRSAGNGKLHATAEADQDCQARDKLNRQEFEAVMRKIQAAWKQNDAKAAASCFSENTTFSNPPGTVRHGRTELYEKFQERKAPIEVEWHHLVFDPSQQIGAAEFTAHDVPLRHGVVILRFSDGLVSSWREYDVLSNLEWRKFVGSNAF